MANGRLGNVRAVLFDMDGLLIDSERIYTEVVNELLRPHGKEQTWEIKSKLMVTLLSELWPPSPDDAADQERGFGSACPFTIEDFLEKRNALLLPAFERVPPMDGAVKLVQHLAKHNIPICVATGSKRRNFQIKANANPDLFKPFAGRVVCGDDKVICRGKPKPDIFLAAAHAGLGLDANSAPWLAGVREPGEAADGVLKGNEGELLVVEDALPGVQAGLAAGMKVVWVPDPNVRGVRKRVMLTWQLRNVVQETGAHQQLESLLHFRPEQWGLPPFDA